MNLYQLLWCTSNLMADAEAEDRAIKGKGSDVEDYTTPAAEFEEMVKKAIELNKQQRSQ